MTTVIIDCKEQKVYTDDCETWTYQKSKNSIVNSMLGVEEKEYEWKDYKNGCVKAIKKKDFIIVGSGCSSINDAFMKGFPDDIPSPKRCAEVFVVYKKGDCVQVIKYDTVKKGKFSKMLKWDITKEIRDSGYLVTGSGSDYAYGALMAGADPVNAIKAASKADTSTSPNVVCYSFEDGTDG